MNGVDLFCGVGGMSLGFQMAGVDVIAAADFNPLAIATHHLNFPQCEAVVADLANVTGQQIRSKTGLGGCPIDVVFGGPPCQGFSFGGIHKNRDPRNRLVMHFAKLVTELSPSYFVMENVKGLLSESHQGLLSRFEKVVKGSGYSIVKPIRALQAKDYGVPQSRSRVFILGYKDGLVQPDYPEPSPASAPTVWDAIRDLTLVDDHDDSRMGDLYWGPLGVPSAYAAAMRSDGTCEPLTGFAPTLHSRKVIKRFKRTKAGTRESISRFQKLKPSGWCSTLRAGTGPENGSFMAPRPIHPYRPRCIYAREAARLHSFPDWFQFDETLWHAFRQIGNSVPPLLAMAVAKSVVAAANASEKLLKAS